MAPATAARKGSNVPVVPIVLAIVGVAVLAGVSFGVYRHFFANRVSEEAESKLAELQERFLPRFVMASQSGAGKVNGSTSRTLHVTVPANGCAGVIATRLEGHCDIDARLTLDGTVITTDAARSSDPVVYACASTERQAEVRIFSYDGLECRMAFQTYERRGVTRPPNEAILDVHADRYFGTAAPLGEVRHEALEHGGRVERTVNVVGPACYGVVAHASAETDLDLEVFAGRIPYSDALRDNYPVVLACVDENTALRIVPTVYSGDSVTANAFTWRLYEVEGGMEEKMTDSTWVDGAAQQILEQMRNMER